MNLCTACKLDFGSVAAFDAHRVGKHAYTFKEGLYFNPPVEDGRRCLDIEEMLAVDPETGRAQFAQNARGTWSLTARLEKTRETFSGRLSTSQGHS